MFGIRQAPSGVQARGGSGTKQESGVAGMRQAFLGVRLGGLVGTISVCFSTLRLSIRVQFILGFGNTDPLLGLGKRKILRCAQENTVVWIGNTPFHNV